MVPQPREDVFKDRRVEAIKDLLAVAPALDQISFLQDRKVMRHRRLGHVKRRRQLTGGSLAPGEQPEDFPARRVGQGLEHLVVHLHFQIIRDYAQLI